MTSLSKKKRKSFPLYVSKKKKKTFLRKQAITSLYFNVSRQQIWDDAFEAYYSDETHSLPVHVAEKISTSIFHQEEQLLNKENAAIIRENQFIRKQSSFFYFFYMSIYMWKNIFHDFISSSLVNAQEYVKLARK